MVQRVAELLLVGAGVALTAAAVTKAAKLAGLVVTSQAVMLALLLVDRGTKHQPRMVGSTEIARAQRRMEAHYRAAYLLAAAQRITRSIAAGKTPRAAVVGERPYWKAHERARRARMLASAAVARAAAEHGVLLGWHIVLDGHATPECKAADGTNFSALHPPLLGWPGTLHGGTCRCRAGAPFPYAQSTDDATAHLIGVRHYARAV